MAAKSGQDKKSGSNRRSADAGEKDRLITELNDRIAFLENELRLKQDCPASQDISEHMRAEEALRESEKKAVLQAEELEALMDIIPAAVWVCRDKDCTRIIGNELANREFTESRNGENISAGSALGEVYDRTRRFFKNGREIAPEELPMQEAVAKGIDVVNSEIDMILPSGRHMTVVGNARPLKSPDGKVRGCVSVFIDITERKRMEEELRRSRDELEQRVRERTLELQRSNEDLIAQIEVRKLAEDSLRKSEEKYRGLFNSIDEGFCIIEKVEGRAGEPPDFRFVEANPAFAEQSGLSDVAGKTIRQVVPGEPEDWFDIYDTVLRTGRPVRFEHNFASQGRVLELYATRVEEENHRRLAVIFNDITERKRAEEELKSAKQQAELYLDLMGHDINNIHQIALGYLELARNINNDTCQEEFLDKSTEVLQRSSLLIKNVRKLQKLRDGIFQIEPVDVAEVLANVQREFGAVPDKAVTLKLEECEHCHVRANELLHDVFANLVSNAIKHTVKRADITIDLGLVEDNGHRYCRVTVEDSGPGIPDEFKGRIFNRLLTGTDKARGMGLGLYLVRSLVESYNGKVWVEDRVPGDHTKGARFVVMLPSVK